jgi:hypothetical protein
MAGSLINGELEGTSKEAVVAHFTVKSSQLPGATQVTTKTSVNIVVVPGEIQIGHIPNSSQR